MQLPCGLTIRAGSDAMGDSVATDTGTMSLEDLTEICRPGGSLSQLDVRRNTSYSVNHEH